eukprot:8977515-Pyramimonas_sp.AAC.1
MGYRRILRLVRIRQTLSAGPREAVPPAGARLGRPGPSDFQNFPREPQFLGARAARQEYYRRSPSRSGFWKILFILCIGFATQALVRAGSTLGRLCKKAHLAIASKPKLVCSNPQVAREVARKLAQHNIRITVGQK